MICSICGGTTFLPRRVLWPDLIAEWQLAPEEVAYVDRQQGTSCAECGANLRAVALGDLIQMAAATEAPLREFGRSHNGISILDLNGCPALSDALAPMEHYHRHNYPEIDMLRMPFDAGTFDLVIHSDTLEHVPNPVTALAECRRILRPSGRLCFTVPIVVGRMTRDRTGVPPSYHGDPTAVAADMLVQTEFGADVWTHAMRAGFKNVLFRQVDHPAAHAIMAWESAG